MTITITDTYDNLTDEQLEDMRITIQQELSDQIDEMEAEEISEEFGMTMEEYSSLSESALYARKVQWIGEVYEGMSSQEYLEFYHAII